jgi:hypothetical protein
MVRDFAFRGFGDRGYIRYVIAKPRFPKLRNHNEIRLGLNFRNFRISKLINHDKKLTSILSGNWGSEFRDSICIKTYVLSKPRIPKKNLKVSLNSFMF